MVSSPEEFHEGFGTETYLSTRYRDIGDFSETTLKGLHKFYSNGASGLKIFEIGCGPVIVHQISAAPYASEIVLSDLVDSNLEAVQLWLDKNPNAHDWTQYFRYVLQTLEGKGEEEEVAKRESQLRSVIKAVIPCDVTKDPLLPPGYEGPYDVVLDSLALGSAGSTDAYLVAALTRISKLIKPGGRFISKTVLVEGATAPSRLHTYPVGDSTFTVMHLSEEQLRSALKHAGFSSITVDRPPPQVSSERRAGAAYLPPGCSFVTALKDSV